MDKQTMTVMEAARALGISRNMCYSLAAEGRLPVIRLGGRQHTGRVLVIRPALERMLAKAEAEAQTK